MILSTMAISVIVFRKVPQFRVIDVDALPKEKTKKVKEQIIIEKLRRISGKRAKKVAKVGTEGVKTASKYGRRIVQKL